MVHKQSVQPARRNGGLAVENTGSSKLPLKAEVDEDACAKGPLGKAVTTRGEATSKDLLLAYSPKSVLGLYPSNSSNVGRLVINITSALPYSKTTTTLSSSIPAKPYTASRTQIPSTHALYESTMNPQTAAAGAGSHPAGYSTVAWVQQGKRGINCSRTFLKKRVG